MQSLRSREAGLGVGISLD